MHRHTTQRLALAVTALCSFGLATLVLADDPPAKTEPKPAKKADADTEAAAKPKAEPASAETPKPAAKSKDAAKPKPATPAKQPARAKPSATVPTKNAGKDATKTQPKRDPAKPNAAPTTKDKNAKNKKPLIVPPGLLSRPPALIPETPPGLGKLNLNRCKIEDIQRLPGVGVVWAPRILAGRPYRTWGDVSRTGVPYGVIVALSKHTELGQP